LLKEKEREVFLNGEVKEQAKVGGFNGNDTKEVKKTFICLKCLHVDEQVSKEAGRNLF